MAERLGALTDDICDRTAMDAAVSPLRDLRTATAREELSMHTVDVPQKDWVRTLDEFSALHEGSLVSLDVVAPTLGVQPQIRELPLRGVTAESGPRGPAIMICAARADGEQITHLIPSPTYLRIARTSEGADVALEIESDEGLAAILRFKTT
jgi:hypothetical protein